MVDSVVILSHLFFCLDKLNKIEQKFIKLKKLKISEQIKLNVKIFVNFVP